MVTLPRGVAHVSYRGGGCFLPVRTPYGRELLVEYVGDLVRSKGLLQVLIDGQRWFVRGSTGCVSANCANCGRALMTRCDHEEAAPHCLRCAFLSEDLSRDMPLERRRAS